MIEYKLTTDCFKQEISSANKAIKQIFEKNYFEILLKNRQNVSSSFIIGVGFNPFREVIISEIIVQKFRETNTQYLDETLWEDIYKK